MTATIGTVIGVTTGTTYQIDGDPAPGFQPLTVNRINAATAGLATDMIVFFSDPIGGLSAATPYYILTVSSGFFTVSTSQGGAEFTVSDSSTVTNFIAIDVDNLTTPSGVVRNDSLNQFFQIDYGDFAERISTSLETIAIQSTTIATQLTTIATKISEIEDYQQTMKTLAEGEGIHIKGPYEWLSMAAIYRIFVEQGIDFDSIKQQVEALPKQQGFE
jgi:hypothetical protein